MTTRKYLGIEKLNSWGDRVEKWGNSLSRLDLYVRDRLPLKARKDFYEMVNENSILTREDWSVNVDEFYVDDTYNEWSFEPRKDGLPVAYDGDIEDTDESDWWICKDEIQAEVNDIINKVVIGTLNGAYDEEDE